MSQFDNVLCSKVKVMETMDGGLHWHAEFKDKATKKTIFQAEDLGNGGAIRVNWIDDTHRSELVGEAKKALPGYYEAFELVLSCALKGQTLTQALEIAKHMNNEMQMQMK